MRIFLFSLIVLFNFGDAFAQVVLKQEAADTGHYIVAFNEPVLKNRTAMTDPDSRRQYMTTLKQRIKVHTSQLKQDLSDTDLQITQELWLRQSAAIVLSPKYLDVLTALPYVNEVRPDHKYRVEPQSETLSNGDIVADDIYRIDLDALWDQGYKGQGVVVAILDSGVDVRHKDLKDRWRGGTNSWFDPNDLTSVTPTDTGHGTGVASIILGGNNHSGGDYLGIAPEATWIAARVIDGTLMTESQIRLVFEWVLNPDNDDSTDDYPDIVQNSWALGSSETVGCEDAFPFSVEFETLSFWGIDVVFSVGNSIGASSYLIPSNDPNVISVGAINRSDEISGSGSGPDRCNSVQIPSLVAPGVSVRLADISNSYTTAGGTSFSAPMVAGALALLRSKYKADNFMDYRGALQESTSLIGQADLPNDDYGYGLVQASAGADKLATYSGVSLVPNEVNFSFARLEAEETDTSISVTLLRSGDLSGSVSVRLTTMNGTAIQGQDYEALNQIVDFLDGENIKVIDITLPPNSNGKGGKNFTAQLTPFPGVEANRNTQILISFKGDATVVVEDEIGGSSFGFIELLLMSLLMMMAGLLRR